MKIEVFTIFSFMLYSCVSSTSNPQIEIISDSAIDLNKILFNQVDSKIFLTNSKKKKNISLDTILNTISNYTHQTKQVTKIVNSRDIKILYTSKNKSTRIRSKSYLSPLVIVENIDNPKKNYLQIIVNKDLAVIFSCLAIMVTLATVIVFCFGRCFSTAKNDALFFANNNF